MLKLIVQVGGIAQALVFCEIEAGGSVHSSVTLPAHGLSRQTFSAIARARSTFQPAFAVAEKQAKAIATAVAIQAALPM